MEINWSDINDTVKTSIWTHTTDRYSELKPNFMAGLDKPYDDYDYDLSFFNSTYYRIRDAMLKDTTRASITFHQSRK